MSSLFSVFSPVSSFGGYSLNWVAVLVVLIFMPSPFYFDNNKFVKLLSLLTKILSSEFKISLGSIKTPGMAHFLVSMFLLIVFSNFMGLFPYVFTATSHLSMTMALAIPIWLGYMVYSTLMNINFFLSHLVPLGTPYPLMPFMVLIEMISSIIRPITLSVRLAANMMAGHLLMALMSGPMVSMPWFIMSTAMLGLLLLTLLELAVSFIQSYVFSTLLSLYVIEVNSPNF